MYFANRWRCLGKFQLSKWNFLSTPSITETDETLVSDFLIAYWVFSIKLFVGLIVFPKGQLTRGQKACYKVAHHAHVWSFPSRIYWAIHYAWPWFVRNGSHSGDMSTICFWLFLYFLSFFWPSFWSTIPCLTVPVVLSHGVSRYQTIQTLQQSK